MYPITLTEPSQRKSVNKGQLEISKALRLLLSHNKISNKGQLEISSELRVL